MVIMTTRKEIHKTVFCYNNLCLKWTDNGKEYMIHVQNDSNPLNPREWSDHDSVFSGWIDGYIGDANWQYDSSEEFWQALVREFCTQQEIDSGFEDDPDYEFVSDFSVYTCMKILAPKAVWLPVYGYSHGGITISAGERTYPYNDRFDSGLAGWIFQLCKPEDDRNAVASLLRHEIEILDHYFTGETYGYTLYEMKNRDWQEIDSCWGFYGDDLYENGIAEAVGISFVLTDVQEGEAKKMGYTSYVYEF